MNPIDQQKVMDAIAFVVLASDVLLELAAAPEVDVEESIKYGAINVKLLDTLDEFIKLLPVPKSFGQRQEYYDLVRSESVSMIWRKFKPANQVIAAP